VSSFLGNSPRKRSRYTKRGTAGRFEPKVASAQPRALCDIEEVYGAERARDESLSPHHALALGVLVQAVQDLQALRAAGLVGRDGRLRSWPTIMVADRGGWRKRFKKVANMEDGIAHKSLKAWFLDGHCQEFLDAIGTIKIDAQRIWESVLRQEVRT
jgi:hypothetical protein